MTDKLNTLRSNMLGAAYNHARAHVEKHRVNVEIYLTNPVGVGEHSDVMDAIEKELEEMAKYQDHMDILDKYFKD
jgi:selenophosphate synthase